jgi:glycosyltransferase involved in cell wall biosynthesis
MNKIYCLFKSIFYFIYEVPMLRFKRLTNKINYENNNPLISIIIATYNRSEILLNRTLPSILKQSYTNYEVIIVGDKCIDETPQLLNNYPDKRVYFLDLKKRGKYPKNVEQRWFVQGAKPRNIGLSLAKGDWLMFISDDDILYPDCLEVLLKHAISTKSEFVSGGYDTIIDGKDQYFPPEPWGPNNIMIGGMPSWLYRSYLSFFKWNIDSWRKKWDRPIDYDLQLRFIRSGVTFSHIKKSVFFYPPVNGTNTSGYKGAILSEKL